MLSQKVMGKLTLLLDFLGGKRNELPLVESAHCIWHSNTYVVEQV